MARPHFVADGLQQALIGHCSISGRAIYSVSKAIEAYQTSMGITYQEALDFYYFNADASHLGPLTPIWSYDLPGWDEEE